VEKLFNSKITCGEDRAFGLWRFFGDLKEVF